MKTILLIATIFCVNFNFFSQEDDFVTDIAYIQEVIVKSNSTQTSLDLNSVNILDYRVYGKDILTLKKQKRNYYIGIEYANKEAENYLLSMKRPSSIFTDCMNNVFILNDDYAYQFVITDKIEIISKLPLSLFYTNVTSCVGNFDNSLLVRKYTNYNKGYALELFDKTSNKHRVIFESLDSIALINYKDILNPVYKTINSQMRNYQSPRYVSLSDRYNQRGSNEMSAPVGFYNVYDVNNRRLSIYTPASEYINPVVQLKRFLATPYMSDDDFFKSLSSSRNIFYAMILKNLYNTKIEIKTFQLDDEKFVVIDRLKESISVYTKEGNLVSEKKFTFKNNIIEMKQDPYTREIYFTSKTENLFKIHRVNINNGTTHYVGGFKNIMLAKTIKIFDGWIYYRVMKNDYYKLYRTRLRS